MKRGEIYMVQFEPSVGREYQGSRPALIVQAAELDTSPLITVVPLTSKVTKGYLSDVVIKKDEINQLWKDSIALPRFVTSFDRTRFLQPNGSYPGKGPLRSIGSVAEDLMRQVDGSLRAHLGLG
jgi:mRNA interferase MazF